MMLKQGQVQRSLDGSVGEGRQVFLPTRETLLQQTGHLGKYAEEIFAVIFCCLLALHNFDYCYSSTYNSFDRKGTVLMKRQTYEYFH